MFARTSGLSSTKGDLGESGEGIEWSTNWLKWSTIECKWGAIEYNRTTQNRGVWYPLIKPKIQVQ